MKSGSVSVNSEERMFIIEIAKSLENHELRDILVTSEETKISSVDSACALIKTKDDWCISKEIEFIASHPRTRSWWKHALGRLNGARSI